MTNIYETTRAKLVAVVAAFKAANYSTTEFNYPGNWVTDVEQATAPFVGVEIDMSSKGRSLPASHCRTVSGFLSLTYYTRENSGSKIFTDFTDALDTYLSLKTISGVTFYEVNPHNDSGRPGFDGVMNVVNFDIDYFNT